MIIHDPKKSAALIIGGLDPASGESELESSDDSVGIAQDVLDAVKSGSAHELAMALKAFHASCEDGYGDEEPDESAE